MQNATKILAFFYLKLPFIYEVLPDSQFALLAKSASLFINFQRVKQVNLNNFYLNGCLKRKVT